MSISSEERRALLSTVRDAAAHGPREFIGVDGAVGRDERLWKALREQIGLGGLLVPEHLGGAGAGVSELAGVLETLAQELAVVPALTSMGMATLALRVVGTPEAEQLMSRIAEGSVDATVAWPDLGGTEGAPSVSAADAGESLRATGRCAEVLDGAQTALLLVPATFEGRTALLVVDGDDPGVRRVPLTGLDLTREVAAVDLKDAAARLVTAEVDLDAVRDLCLVAIAAEQVGVAQRTFDVALSWAKERVQFDRPIGQFQALKHLIADLFLDLELARTGLDLAVEAAESFLADPSGERRFELAVAASVAKARCGDAAMRIADESLHVLGGIGFTWEHDAHLYYRRAKVLELVFGDPATHRDRFAKMLLDGAEEADQ